MHKKYFVTGIGTDVGKTVASAIISQYLGATYWKPIQAGGLDATDTMLVKQMVNHPNASFLEERFRLQMPASPHAAAEAEGIQILCKELALPSTLPSNQTLVIEGAGGIMVPINAAETMLDVIKQSKAEVILVSKNYLGSINHTLLSAMALKNENIPVKGIIFNGDSNPASESIICKLTGFKVLFRIPHFSHLDADTIAAFVQTLPEHLL